MFLRLIFNPFNMEKTIETRLKKEVEKLGWKCLKCVCPGNDGMPDRKLLAFPARTVYVETKSKTGKLSPIQLVRHRQLCDLGFPVYLVWDEITLKNLLNDLKKLHTVAVSGSRN